MARVISSLRVGYLASRHGLSFRLIDSGKFSLVFAFHGSVPFLIFPPPPEVLFHRIFSWNICTILWPPVWSLGSPAFPLKLINRRVRCVFFVISNSPPPSDVPRDDVGWYDACRSRLVKALC